jgi:hypothetical protein
MAADASTGSDAKTTAVASVTGGRTADELRGVADALRSRVDLFGKALATIATLGTTAVGLNKIGDLFPTAGHDRWALAACLALGAAALAAIWVGVRLMMVAGPAFISPDPSDKDDVDSGERKDEVEPILKVAASRYGHSSITGLLERERAVRAVASLTADAEERARLTTLADEIKTEIEQALARAQVAVVRRRAKNAVSDWLSWALYIAVIAGLLVFAVGTDKISSDRVTIADAKACADARKAGATPTELGNTDTCDPLAAKTASQGESLSAAEARAQLSVKVAAAVQACVALASERGQRAGKPLTDEACKPLRATLVALNQP